MRVTGLACCVSLGLSAAACRTDVEDSGFFTQGGEATTDTAASSGEGGQTSQTSTDPSSGTAGTAGDPTAGETTAGSSSGEDDGVGALCGDGLITGNEECDCAGGACTEEGLNFIDCTMAEDPLAPGVLTGGTLGCNQASCRYDTTLCTYCGDGTINGNEACEPDIAINSTCADIGMGTAGQLSCDTACQLDTTACTDCGYVFEFADCDEGWTTGRTNNQAALSSWACGEYSLINTGPEVGVTGVWATNLNGPYSNVESSFLQSPVLNLANCDNEAISMTLRHWYNFEGGVQNSDGGLVQVSTNGGTSWTTLVPTSGSPYAPNPTNASHEPVEGQVGFSAASGDELEWVESTFDLTPYAGNGNVLVRFVFGSDGSNTAPGWYLDRLEIIGSGAG